MMFICSMDIINSKTDPTLLLCEVSDAEIDEERYTKLKDLVDELSETGDYPRMFMYSWWCLMKVGVWAIIKEYRLYEARIRDPRGVYKVTVNY